MKNCDSLLFNISGKTENWMWSSVEMKSKPIKTECPTSSKGVPYFFKDDFINESNAFTKYYEAIKKNGYILNIIDEVENMGDYCDLFNDVCRDYSNETLNLYCEPNVENEQNENILYAVPEIKLINSPSKGRCLLANSGIQKNKILIQELPTVMQVNPVCACVGDNESSLYRCHNCGTACKLFFTCDGCNVCIFCSRSCLLSAYKNYHRYECYGIQRHFWPMDDTNYSYLSLRMLLYGTSKQFETDTVGSCYGSSKNNYPYIYKLESHFNKLPWAKINEILYASVKNLIYLISKTTFFNQYKEEEKYKLHDLYLYIGGLLVKHYCQAQANSVLLKFQNLPAEFGFNVVSGRGKAICPTIALLNHSCSPNAAILIYNQYIVVKSLKPIRKGEEITICYSEVDSLLTVSERQTITEELFHFTCDCNFCSYERNWSEAPYKCQICTTGRAKKIDLPDGKSMGYCLKCQKKFNLNSIMENIKAVKICRNLYNATYSIDHVTRIAECYSNIFPSDSWHLLDVYKLLYEKYALLKEKPLEVLKYGLLSFNILEHYISRLYIPLLMAKIRFIIRAANMKALSHIKMVSENEFSTMKIFVEEVIKVKEDLLFYLPKERISFHHDLLVRVHQIFQSMVVE